MRNDMTELDGMGLRRGRRGRHQPKALQHLLVYGEIYSGTTARQHLTCCETLLLILAGEKNLVLQQL